MLYDRLRMDKRLEAHQKMPRGCHPARRALRVYFQLRQLHDTWLVPVKIVISHRREGFLVCSCMCDREDGGVQMSTASPTTFFSMARKDRPL